MLHKMIILPFAHSSPLTSIPLIKILPTNIVKTLRNTRNNRESRSKIALLNHPRMPRKNATENEERDCFDESSTDFLWKVTFGRIPFGSIVTEVFRTSERFVDGESVFEWSSVFIYKKIFPKKIKMKIGGKNKFGEFKIYFILKMFQLSKQFKNHSSDVISVIIVD